MIYIGRIKQRFIKNTAKALIKKNPDKFSTSFEKNKEYLKELNVIESRSVRNKIAGYAAIRIKNKAF